MINIRYALILAAGRGTRMEPLTDIVPKAMAPVGGTTLIAKGLKSLHGKIAYVYVTVGYKGPMLAQHVIEQNVSGVFNTAGHENAWWLFNTIMRELDEPIFVLTCDNVIELDFDLLRDEYASKGCPPCMVVPVKPIPSVDGDYIVQHENVVVSISRRQATEIYCSGIQVLHPKKVNALMPPANRFYEVWANLIHQRALFCSSIYPRKWYAVDTIQQLSALRGDLAAQRNADRTQLLP